MDEAELSGFRWDANTLKKESTPDAATHRLSFSEQMWINSRERRRE